jgi:hypothetical protein
MEDNITFEFKVLNLQILPQLREFKNVIKRVNLLVTARYFSVSDNTYHSANHIELIGLPDPDSQYSLIKDPNDPDFFVTFEQITEDNILEWLNITNPIMGDIKKKLTNELTNFVNSYEPQDIGLPWIK